MQFSQRYAASILAKANGAFFTEHPDLAAKMFEARDARIADQLSRKNALAFRAGMFLRSVNGDPAAAKWCREQKIAIRKAESTQPNSAGGVLVPDEIANAIISLLEVYGVTRSYGTAWPMVSDTLTVPRSPTTAWSVSFSAENGAANFSDIKFDGVGLTAKKLSAYAKLSSELLEDSVEALGVFFMLGMAQAFAQKEDQCAFLGDGTSTYGGIRGISSALADGSHGAGKVTAASGHTGFTSIDSADIGAAIAALPARAMPNAKIYISTGGYGAALVRLASIGGGMVATIDANGELQANWHGLPVVLTQVLPSSTGSLASQMILAIGDLSQAIAFGARRDLAIRTFTETFADVDQVMIRGTERLDVIAHDLGDNSNAGAVVGLFAAAS